MRNDTEKWDAPVNSRQMEIEGDGVLLTCATPIRQTIISGPIDTCLDAVNQTKASGWPDIVRGDQYALRLRRDRILMVNGAKTPEGWQQEGIAVSDMSGAYRVIEINGPRALELLNLGGEMDIETASASVVRQFHGIPALIYRRQEQDRFRVHITREYLQALWHRLQQFP